MCAHCGAKHSHDGSFDGGKMLQASSSPTPSSSSSSPPPPPPPSKPHECIAYEKKDLGELIRFATECRGIGPWAMRIWSERGRRPKSREGAKGKAGPGAKSAPSSRSVSVADHAAAAAKSLARDIATQKLALNVNNFMGSIGDKLAELSAAISRIESRIGNLENGQRMLYSKLFAPTSPVLASLPTSPVLASLPTPPCTASLLKRSGCAVRK